MDEVHFSRPPPAPPTSYLGLLGVLSMPDECTGHGGMPSTFQVVRCRPASLVIVQCEVRHNYRVNKPGPAPTAGLAMSYCGLRTPWSADTLVCGHPGLRTAWHPKSRPRRQAERYGQTFLGPAHGMSHFLLQPLAMSQPLSPPRLIVHPADDLPCLSILSFMSDVPLVDTAPASAPTPSALCSAPDASVALPPAAASAAVASPPPDASPPPVASPAPAATSAVPSSRCKCRFCDTVLADSSGRSRHEARFHKPKVPCSVCSRPLSAIALKSHARTCRAPPPPPPAASANPGGESALAAASGGIVAAADATASSSPAPPAAGAASSPPAPSSPSSDDIEESTADFLQWLGQCPATEAEKLAKPRRLTTELQLEPIRRNLAFLLHAAGTPELNRLIQPAAITAVMTPLEARGIGSERIYQLSLLLRKVAVYITSRQWMASGVSISPASLPGWNVIDSYARDSGRKRKQRQRDLIVLDAEDQKHLTVDELKAVLSGCLSRMDDIMQTAAGRTLARGGVTSFTELFITAMLVVLFAPRQQVLRSLTMETLQRPGTPANPGTTYVIKMSAEKSKTGHPVLLRVPERLTVAMDFYLSRILLPSVGKGWTGPVFLDKGSPRIWFSPATRAATQAIIGRPINAHKLRHAVATLFYSHQGSSEALMRQLADTMNHSVEQQRQYYIRQDRLGAQARMHEMLMEGVKESAAVSANEDEEDGDGDE